MQKTCLIDPRACFALLLCVLVVGFSPLKTSQAQTNPPATPFQRSGALEFSAPVGASGTVPQPMTAAADGSEYIQNGSFDNGIASWMTDPNDGSVVINSQNWIDGPYSVRMSTSSSTASLWQTVHLPHWVNSARLTFYAGREIATSETLYLNLSDADTGDVLAAHELFFSTIRTWYLFSFDIDPSLIAGRNVNVTFTMNRNNNLQTHSLVYVDVVSLTVSHRAVFLPAITTPE